MMKLQALSVVAFCLSRAYGEPADGYVDFDGVVIPTEQCVFDGDGNGFIFSCDYVNATAVMYLEYFDGSSTCSGSGVESEVTGYDYDCTPVGYMTFDIEVASCPSGFDGGSTAIANGICHDSSITNTNTIYKCNSSSFTIERYSDSNCTMMINSTTIDDCYYLEDVDTGSIGVQPAYLSLTSCISGPTTTTSGPETSTTESGDDETTTDGPTTTLGDVDLSDYYGGYFTYSGFGFDAPIPIDECIPVNVDTDTYDVTYGKATCNNAGTSATLRTYGSDSECSGSADETIDGESGEFDCDSVVRYASLGVGACGFAFFNLVVATGRCFELLNYTAVTCDAETMAITLWEYADDECTQLAGKLTIGEDDCLDFSLSGTSVTVFPNGCQNPTPAPTKAAETTGAPDSDKAVGLASTIGFTLVTIMVFVAAVVIV